ncbi:MAG TPA: tripartite tricarboxylate transporter permease [bacterium]|nr:tripartite tricarboxylate transporter permease [bacterium]
MDVIYNLIAGFHQSLTGFNILMMLVGSTAGLFIGAMPGLGSINGVAILLPVTFLVPPTSAIIFLGAIYYGAMYGGAISSIMLGIPGASTAVATTFDGRPMAQNGEADVALVAAATASFIGGTISIILFTLFAPPLADFALKFGQPEEFTLMVLAFSTFVGLGGDDLVKTLFCIFIGLALSAVGLDVISGRPRLIFMNLPGFYHGINFLVLAIGIYGIGEVLWTIETNRGAPMMAKAEISVRRIWNALKSLRHSWGTITMGSLLGYFVGVLPAAGATPGSLMAYGMAKSMSRTPQKFGTGFVDGVVAPEAANNAASTGSMLPMLTLGIPGSPTTAILLGGMVIWGLEPGPMLFVEHKDFVWGLISSLYLANVATVLINIGFIPAFIMILRLPFTILAPIIFVLCLVGGYAPTNDLHDVWLMLIFGFGGYIMRKLNYPMAPIVLAIVLGPLSERSLRQSLIASHGSWSVFVTRPLSLTFLLLSVGLFVLPFVKARISAMKRAGA